MTAKLKTLLAAQVARIHEIEKAMNQLEQQILWAQQHNMGDLENGYCAGVRVLAAQHREVQALAQALRMAIDN